MAPMSMVQEVVSLRGRVSLGVERCKIVFLDGTSYSVLFRHFCSPIMHAVVRSAKNIW